MSNEENDVVEIGQLNKEEFSHKRKDSTIPVVIRPKKDKSLDFLIDYVKKNQEKLIKLYHENGALLFRGFEINKPQDMEDVVILLSPNLGNEYLGTSPREMLTKYTFTSTELPGVYPIPQHLEMSFLKSSTPGTLFFSCMIEPKEGGETPLCDFIKVAEELDNDIKQKFEKLGIIHYRNYVGPKQCSIDPWKLKKWPEIFKSTDKNVVQEKCKRDELEVEWLSGDALRLSQKIPAFKTHKRTGKQVWANHSDVFHTSQAFGEYSYISKKTGKFFDYILYIFLIILTFLRVLLVKAENQGMNSTFGDKTLISDKEMEKVRKVVWSNMVIYKWKKGDLVMIDNHRISHGRLPFNCDRKIIVSWGESY